MVSAIFPLAFFGIASVVLTLVGRRVVCWDADELTRRLAAHGGRGVIARIVCAGVGWWLSGIVATAASALLVVREAYAGDGLRPALAFAWVAWLVVSALSALASVVGRPRLLVLPVLRSRGEWRRVVRRLAARST